MMPRRIAILFALAALVTGTASAQFLGDALASAGLNITEADAAAAIAASGAFDDPFATTATVSTPGQAKVYSPETVGTEVGGRATVATPGVTSPTSSAPPPAGAGSTPEGGAAVSLPQGDVTIGGTSGISGVAAHRATIDPKAAALWADAFRPVGTRLQALPSGAVPLKVGDGSYSYAMGMFLQKKGNAWEVVAAPHGAAITEKPVGAATVFAEKKPYTYYVGTFYVYDAAQKAYVVVAPPAGATVNYIPEAAKKTQKSEGVRYEYAGTSYKPVYRGSSVVYTVAG